MDLSEATDDIWWRPVAVEVLPLQNNLERALFNSSIFASPKLGIQT